MLKRYNINNNLNSNRFKSKSNDNGNKFDKWNGNCSYNENRKNNKDNHLDEMIGADDYYNSENNGDEVLSPP